MNDPTQEGRPDLSAEDELALALDRGRKALSGGDAEDAIDALDEAVTIARRLSDDASEAEAQGLLAQAFLRTGEPEEAARAAQMALEIARARRDDAAAHHFEGLLLTARSSPEELEMSTTFGDGRQALLEGDPGRAVGPLERSLALADEVGHAVARAAATQLLAQAYLGVERFEEAKTLAARAESLSEELGDQEAAERAREIARRAEGELEEGPLATGIAKELRWGQEALAAGEVERGIRHLERARDQAVEGGDLVPEASACGLLAQAYFERGRQEDAVEAASRALEIAESLGHEDAASDFRSLLAVVESGPEALELARALQVGGVALQAGELEKAAEQLETARALAKSQGNAVSEALACAMLAKVRVEQGRGDEARALIARGEELLGTSGDDEASQRFRQMFEKLMFDGSEP